VFLNSPGQSGTGGEILIDERTFVSSHVQTVDMTGRLSAQGNQIVIEGAGNAGAIFSWVLTGADSDPSRPSIIKTTGVSSGQSFLIHGTGFGGDTSKIKVMLDDQAAQVMSVDQGIIEAKAPDNLKSTTMISVQVDGKSSNSMPVTIDRVAPYLASLSPLGGPVGTLMTIQGANFSPLARDNIVKVGAQRAEVFKVVDSHTLLFYAPNWGSAWGTLPVTVISGGVPSSNHLEFWCTAHLYGGNPNAAGYAND
ncbi:MAG: IPT/TIG domain-containing protein, partial [Cyanobacteria bacterium]|nr:IPT/TIG domain-containing protein [Cyanobacteriota bacterium]